MNIKESFRQYILAKLGVNHRFQQTNESIDSLYYYLNQLVDISSIPPTKDTHLRQLQQCDALLIGIFHELCRKHNLCYWLDYGTLLGAVRHRGFVPWDDDTDLCMPREDWEKALELLPSELEKYGISFYEESDRLCMAYQHEDTGIWIDIFVVDSYAVEVDDTAHRDILLQQIKDYQKEYKLHVGKTPQKSLADLSAARERIVGRGHGMQKLFWRLQFGNINIFKEGDLLPVSGVIFEGLKLNGPADKEVVLRTYYGDYMQFPKSGLMHHGEAFDRPPLSQWGTLHHVDMGGVKDKLCSVLHLLK